MQWLCGLWGSGWAKGYELTFLLGRFPGPIMVFVDAPLAADFSLLCMTATATLTPQPCTRALPTPIAADRAAADPRLRAAAQGHRHQRHRLRAPGLGEAQPITRLERGAQGCGVASPGRTTCTRVWRPLGRSSELGCVQSLSSCQQGHPVNAELGGASPSADPCRAALTRCGLCLSLSLCMRPWHLPPGTA